MDALSSQATVAGYKAVLLAAEHARQVLPDAHDRRRHDPAGEGARARRRRRRACRRSPRRAASGAVVSAFDVRPVVKEQVESLGASFLELDVEGDEGAGGYASSSPRTQHAREQELIARHVAEADAVITTALIPGRPAPVLITEEAVAACGRARSSSTSPPRPAATARDRAGRDGRARRRHDRRPDEPARDDAGPREPDVLAQRPEPSSGSSSRTARSCSTSRTRSSARRCVAHGGKRHEGARAREPGRSSRSITVFVLAVFLGIELISRVPALLHTPLMSGTNAIHGIVLVGAMLDRRLGRLDARADARASSRSSSATINVVGGFLVTDRMLEMFKRRPERPEEPE